LTQIEYVLASDSLVRKTNGVDARPVTQYALTSDGAQITYQVQGNGPLKGVPDEWRLYEAT
jgi:hypothetical protein